MGIWLLGGLFALIMVNLGIFFGAPYLPILPAEREQLLDLVALEAGQTVLDLGCGDGTLLLAVAKRGGRAIGYEISPFWWLVARVRTWRYHKLVTVYFGNYWHQDWPQVDIIYVFLITRYMHQAQTEFTKRLDYPVQVASYGFALPDLPAAKQVGAVYLYQFPANLPN